MIAEPPPKRPKTIWSALSQPGQAVRADTSQKSKIIEEIERYKSIEAISPIDNSNPFDWWRQNQSSFPILAKLARKYLSAPLTSVASERLFSSAGLIYANKKRSRLSGSKAEKLLLIKATIEMAKGENGIQILEPKYVIRDWPSQQLDVISTDESLDSSMELEDA